MKWSPRPKCCAFPRWVLMLGSQVLNTRCIWVHGPLPPNWPWHLMCLGASHSVPNSRAFHVLWFSVFSMACAPWHWFPANQMRNCSMLSLHGSSMHLCQGRFTFWDWTNLFPVCSRLQASGSSTLLPCVCNLATPLCLPSSALDNTSEDRKD
jgi:hypothetical protein